MGLPPYQGTSGRIADTGLKERGNALVFAFFIYFTNWLTAAHTWLTIDSAYRTYPQFLERCPYSCNSESLAALLNISPPPVLRLAYLTSCP